jgi:hypothetical protein
MRNDKGVRIVMDTKLSGLGLGVGPRGITLSVGEAEGAPADASPRLPQTLGFGRGEGRSALPPPYPECPDLHRRLAQRRLQRTVVVGPVHRRQLLAGALERRGSERPLPGRGAWERSRGRVSGIYSLTASGPDGAASNGSKRYRRCVHAGERLSRLAIGGRLPAPRPQRHRAQRRKPELPGLRRPALLGWRPGTAPTAARAGSRAQGVPGDGIARLNLEGFMFEGVHLKYNDHPDTQYPARGGADRVRDGRLGHEAPEGRLHGLRRIRVGHRFRDGMNGIYVYHEATPLPELPDFTYQASFVRESNSKSSRIVGGLRLVRHARVQAFAPALGIPSSATATRRSAAAGRGHSTLSSRVSPTGAPGPRESSWESSSSPTAT